MTATLVKSKSKALNKEVARRKKLGIAPRPRKAADFKELKTEMEVYLRALCRKHEMNYDELMANAGDESVEWRAYIEEQTRKAYAALWKLKCPPKYNGTFDAVRSPTARDVIAKVLDWQFGARGLFVIGATGKSKTWSLWTLLRRLFVDERLSVRVFDGVQFANEAAAAFGNPESAERWLSKCMKPDVLAIDDLAKRFTPASQQAFFALIDRRTAQLKPVLITANLHGESLSEMLADSEMEDPLRRRLREHCEVVVF
jgi:DNA replication protein DnaC